MPITEKLRREIFERDDYTCQYCGKKLSEGEAQLDHIIPQAKGGGSDASNLTTACFRCNALKGDEIWKFVSSPVSKQLATGWIYAFSKAPRITGITSILGLIIAIASVTYLEKNRQINRGDQLLNQETYTTQINNLQDTEKQIRGLLDFVVQQQAELTQTEKAINDLEAEHNALKPLVESDRQVVDSLFKAQEARYEKSAGRERWIGFGLGVLASIVASTILIILRFFINKIKGPNQSMEDNDLGAA